MVQTQKLPALTSLPPDYPSWLQLYHYAVEELSKQGIPVNDATEVEMKFRVSEEMYQMAPSKWPKADPDAEEPWFRTQLYRWTMGEIKARCFDEMMAFPISEAVANAADMAIWRDHSASFPTVEIGQQLRTVGPWLKWIAHKGGGRKPWE